MTGNSGTNASHRIEVAGVGKRFGDLQVFRDINLSIGEREIVTIVGPSGCGKTTLLRCIDGLIPYDDGDIRIEGERVEEPGELAAAIKRCKRAMQAGRAYLLDVLVERRFEGKDSDWYDFFSVAKNQPRAT